MKRSPFAFAFLFVLLAAVAVAQNNSAEPQPASSMPKTPIGGNTAPTQPMTPATQPAAPLPEPPAPTGAPATMPAGNSPQPAATAKGESGTAVPAEAAEPLVEPPKPKTEVFDSSVGSANGLTTDGHDPILDPPPLPAGNATLVGGIVSGIDQIHNRVSIRVFGGGHWKVNFDERTHIYRNGIETTQLAIKKGERVYVDTMLDRQRHEVFARNIRIGVPVPSADADGQITQVDPLTGTVTLRDQINSSPIQFSVDRNTRIIYGSNPATLNELKPQSLVHVRFSPERSNRGLAREIRIIAAPGSSFTYIGRITYLDMHRGTLALVNGLDQRTYEIHFDPIRVDARDSLAIGSEVRIVAVFEGMRYTAQSITVTRTASAAEREKR